ncbi:nsun2 [Ecytonucleospora hepatopenaei]|uniref:Nsun2 n=1 Tax=Ecytonucleospora hepatopenaei TaxID=646526 RepID=A0A1W0E4P9_9MICR|nr:nsun2 [Ecytonucleospora hepatopenaei]
MKREVKNDKLADYLAFYKNALKLIDEDYDLFKKCITEPLPFTFRVTETQYKNKILEILRKRFNAICKEKSEGIFTFYKKKQLFGDDGQCILTKHNIDLESYKKEYESFNEFLVNACEMGYVQRQEIVSMIPVNLLGVVEGDFVYEPCAAPGSKTKQILEKLKGTGLLVSNDLSKQRINVLVTESKKNDSRNLVVTSNNAATIKYKESKGTILFDKICCDVPCSGDGTIRKNFTVRSDWSVESSSSQVHQQLQILKNTLKMLKKGGTCVYSTCSLNPAENEYVVNEVIKDKKYNLCTSSMFMDLKYREGITKFDAIPKYAYENEELEKCYRFYPHDNDTGGFFAAIICKNIDEGKNEENQISFPSNFIPFTSQSNPGVNNELVIDTECRYLANSMTMNIIHAINKNVYWFLCYNNHIRIVVVGMRAYKKTRCVEDDGYYYKIDTTFLNKCPYEALPREKVVEMDHDCFKMACLNVTIDREMLRNKNIPCGLFIASYKDIKYIGYIYKDRFTLFINKFNRLVLKYLT